MLVEQHHMVAALELFQYQFALLLFLLLFAEVVGGFQFGNHYQFEGQIVADAAGIVLDAGGKMLVGGLAHHQ